MIIIIIIIVIIVITIIIHSNLNSGHTLQKVQSAL